MGEAWRWRMVAAGKQVVVLDGVEPIAFAQPAVPAVAHCDVADLVAQDHAEDAHRGLVAGLLVAAMLLPPRTAL